MASQSSHAAGTSQSPNSIQVSDREASRLSAVSAQFPGLDGASDDVSDGGGASRGNSASVNQEALIKKAKSVNSQRNITGPLIQVRAGPRCNPAPT